MKKYFTNTRKIMLFVMVIVLATVGVQIVYGDAGEPGSQQDPIITQSYLEEMVVPQLYDYINENIGNLTKKIDALPAQQGQDANKFNVVTVNAGQQLIGGAGTELILRQGSASIISTEKGGLADTTQGKDLQNGEKMPPNHLLIIPLEDGRGFTANEDSVLVMVKGTYTIRQ